MTMTNLGCFRRKGPPPCFGASEQKESVRELRCAGGVCLYGDVDLREGSASVVTAPPSAGEQSRNKDEISMPRRNTAPDGDEILAAAAAEPAAERRRAALQPDALQKGTAAVSVAGARPGEPRGRPSTRVPPTDSTRERIRRTLVKLGGCERIRTTGWSGCRRAIATGQAGDNGREGSHQPER